MIKKNIHFVLVLLLFVFIFILSSCSSNSNGDISSTEVSNNGVETPNMEETENATLPTNEPTLDATQTSENEKEKIDNILNDYHNYLQANDVNGALQVLASALEVYPNNQEVLLTRSQLYFETLQFDLALEDVNQVLIDNPDSIKALYLQGNIYFSQGEREKAVNAFEKVIELDANYLDAYIQLGFLYYDSAETDKAIETFNKYIELADDGEDKNYIIDFVDTLISIQSTQEAQETQVIPNEE